MKIPQFLIAAFVSTAAFAASAQDAVVYHIDNSEGQAVKGLRNIRNHMDTDPGAKITVVTHANGVDFLIDRKSVV